MLEQLRWIREFLRGLRDSWTEARAVKLDTIQTDTATLKTTWTETRAGKLDTIQSDIDKICYKPTTIIAKTTTPLPAGGTFTTGKIPCKKYEHILIYAHANTFGHFKIWHYTEDDKILRETRIHILSDMHKVYISKTISSKCEVKYTNDGAAQTVFTFTVEGVR